MMGPGCLGVDTAVCNSRLSSEMRDGPLEISVMGRFLAWKEVTGTPLVMGLMEVANETDEAAAGTFLSTGLDWTAMERGRGPACPDARPGSPDFCRPMGPAREMVAVAGSWAVGRGVSGFVKNLVGRAWAVGVVRSRAGAMDIGAPDGLTLVGVALESPGRLCVGAARTGPPAGKAGFPSFGPYEETG